MNKDAAGGAQQRRKSFAHVAEASWGKGLNALMRITRMTLRHPWQAGDRHRLHLRRRRRCSSPSRACSAAPSTRRKADRRGAGAAPRTRSGPPRYSCSSSASLRGLFTMVQNYYGESVGHHVGYELRLAFYEKIQRLSFGFHDRVHTGDLITIGMLDLEGVRMFFSTGIVRLVLLTVLHRRRRLAADLHRPGARPARRSASCPSSPGAPR